MGVRVTPERDGDDADWEGGLLDGSKCFLCLEEPSRRKFNWTDRRRRQAEDLGDPVEALMKCGVSDVLEVLREVGFDVEAFGDRSVCFLFSKWNPRRASFRQVADGLITLIFSRLSSALPRNRSILTPSKASSGEFTYSSIESSLS